MESSSRENDPGVEQDRQGGWGHRRILAGLIKWVAALLQLTEAEQEEAGIYIERVDGE